MNSCVAAFQRELATRHPAHATAQCRVFASVTKVHASSSGNGAVVGGYCRVENAGTGGAALTLYFDADSFAHPSLPMYIGPVKLPCLSVKDVRIGTVLYGVAVRSVTRGTFAMRWCTDGAALLSLCRALDEGTVQGMWRARPALQLAASPETADELLLVGLLLLGDLEALAALSTPALTVAAAATAASIPAPTSVSAFTLPSASAHPLAVSDEWRAAPTTFVAVLALMTNAPILLHRYFHFMTAKNRVGAQLKNAYHEITEEKCALFKTHRERAFLASGLAPPLPL